MVLVGFNGSPSGPSRKPGPALHGTFYTPRVLIVGNRPWVACRLPGGPLKKPLSRFERNACNVTPVTDLNEIFSRRESSGSNLTGSPGDARPGGGRRRYAGEPESCPLMGSRVRPTRSRSYVSPAGSRLSDDFNPQMDNKRHCSARPSGLLLRNVEAKPDGTVQSARVLDARILALLVGARRRDRGTPARPMKRVIRHLKR